MDEAIRYVLLGDPIPLARARHGNRKTYDIQREVKLVQGIELARQHDGRPFYEGPVIMHITFFLPIPTANSLKRKEAMRNSPHIYKPDLSNLIKFIEDIGTGILYKDDCIIYEIISKKMYDTQPRTEFTILEFQ